VRAAFYYPWYPEHWQSPEGTKYHPTLGFYDSADPAIIDKHIKAMMYGKVDVGIASWWGPGSPTDGRINALLDGAGNTSFRWALYYEQEGYSNPSVSKITSDLEYIKTHYAQAPTYYRIGGRFVVFVYADPNDACAMADRWKQADTVGAYIVLKVFLGYKNCASQPDGWHQYGPAVAEDPQPGYSFSISPGFNKFGEQNPRLARDLTRWNTNIRDMIASRAPFQLITTFNEWNEGTSVESADEWTSSSGYGPYLDALHNDGS
jgi:hypothetical protein